MIFSVTDRQGLDEALAQAKGGDTIALAAGDYGDLVLNSKTGHAIDFGSGVTITSQDASAPASFSGMALNGAEGLTFDGVVFDYTFEAGDTLSATPFQIRNSSDITIRNALFDGDVASGRNATDDGYATGKGLTIIGSDGITVENSEFTTWHRGLAASTSSGLTVTGNDIHSIRSDGMNFAEVQSVLIEGNHIHDFRGSADSSDHLDMIQFWTSGTGAPSEDIVIRGNVLDIGEGSRTQSIFMRNELVDNGKAGAEMYYQNVLIEDNVILNGHSHGITVGETAGLEIRSNTVLSVDAGDARFFAVPRINLSEDSTGVTVAQNAAGGITGAGKAALLDNVLVQNSEPGQDGYYEDLFVASSMQDGAGGYMAAPGSLLDSLSAGAAQQLPQAAAGAQFDIFSDGEAPGTLIFDASHSLAASGQALPADAVFTWVFGDGSTARGAVVEHAYGAAGSYDVTLTVTSAAGSQTASAAAQVAGGGIVSFDADSGSFVAPDGGAGAVLAETGSGGALALGGQADALELSRADIARFFAGEGFALDMTLAADAAGNWGEVARIHGSFIVSVKPNGGLEVKLFQESGGTVSLVAPKALLNDGAEHDVSVRLADGSLEIHVDGELAAGRQVSEAMPADGSWGLSFGSGLAAQTFGGALSSFALSGDAPDYPAYGGSTVPEASQPGSGAGGVESETGAGTDGGTDGGAGGVLPDSGAGTGAGPDPVAPDTGAGGDGGVDGGAGSDGLDAETDVDVDAGTDVDADAAARFLADFAGYADSGLEGDAKLHVAGDGTVLQLGADGFLDIGRLEAFEEADQLSVTAEFSKAEADGGDMRLVWNHGKIGVVVQEDGLKIHIGQEGTPFHQGIALEGLGLDDTGRHEVTVMADAEADRLQVVLDGEVVLDHAGVDDIQFAGAGGREWGWTLGSAWGHDFHGDVHALEISDAADFQPVLPEDGLLS